MKILKFNLFEAKYSDIEFISSLDKYFTIAFEFEIETDDRKNINIDFEDLNDQGIFDDALKIVKTDLKLSKQEYRFISSIINSIIDMIDTEEISNDEFLDLLDINRYSDKREIEIITYAKNNIMSHILTDDLGYMTKNVKKYLPQFTKKWRDEIMFIEDATLDRGIEIKPKTYLDGISKGIEMINDFYNDLNNQDYWHFSTRTGIHINIGIKDQKVEWNPIKGLIMLNDFNNDPEQVPFTFKKMTWRMNNNFCGSLLPAIKNIPKTDIDKVKNDLNLNDVKGVERILNKFISEKVKEWGHKSFGFNITKTEHNYIEFRYVGGLVDKEILIEKLKYFSFITYAMTSISYKRKEYLKKLYKFIYKL